MSTARYISIVAVIGTIVATICILSFWTQFAPGDRQPIAEADDEANDDSEANADRFYDESIVNPATYSSDSKSFRLSVNPSDRNGRAGAAYEMTRNGARVWASELPFTLLHVVVTDSGEVVGYSYSQGLEDFGPGQEGGDFRVVILGPDGTPRLNEATKRQPSKFLHVLPDPKANGHVIDEAHDRVLFRIADPDVNRNSESWWIYELSTGRSVGRVNPRERMKEPQHLSLLIDARAVKGTPLILLHWWRYQYPDPSGQRSSIIGGRFVLVDEKADPVWELELPRDYVIPEDEEAQDLSRAACRR